MDNMFEKLDNEMLEKIQTLVNDMGGELTQIDLDTKTLSIDIVPEDESGVYHAVDYIINEYAVKKKAILEKSPFYRAQLVQDDLEDVG